MAMNTAKRCLATHLEKSIYYNTQAFQLMQVELHPIPMNNADYIRKNDQFTFDIYQYFGSNVDERRKVMKEKEKYYNID